MHPHPKTAIVISPASTTNGGTASGWVDTKGFGFAVIDVLATTSNNTTNNFSVLTLGEGDTTSAFTAFETGDTDFTVPAADTASAQVVAQFRVNLTGRKRYLQVAASPVTTQTITAVAHLFKAADGVVSASEAGAGVVVSD